MGGLAPVQVLASSGKLDNYFSSGSIMSPDVQKTKRQKLANGAPNGSAVAVNANDNRVH